MTYKFNKETHTAKIKAGLETAKKKGKKLGRPKGGKIKGEDEVIEAYNRDDKVPFFVPKMTYSEIAKEVGVSIGTVQKIINKYKANNGQTK